MLQALVKLANKLTSNQKKFIAEVIGTFILVVFATGSVVLDPRMNGVLGIPFIAFGPFVGVAIGVYVFRKISMAHFKPAVTVGFQITKHITQIQLDNNIAGEIIGALLGSLFVKYLIGSKANLGPSVPNYAFPLPIIFGVEVLASALMAVILVVVYTKGLKRFSGIAIGGIESLSSFFIYFRRFYESGPLVSACLTFWCSDQSMALLVCYVLPLFYEKKLSIIDLPS